MFPTTTPWQETVFAWPIHSEGDGRARSKERKTSDGSLCETQVDDKGEGESEHKGSSCEGEPEDSSPSKLTEMTVEYEPLGVNR